MTNAHEALGKYVVSFQRIPFTLHSTIQLMLKKYGLKDEEGENKIAQIILADRSVEQLLRMNQAIIAHYLGDKSDDYKVIKEITNFVVHDILQHRNNILHAFIHVDNDNSNDIMVWKDRLGGGTGHQVVGFPDSSHLDKQIRNTNKIADLLHYIWLNIEKNDRVIGHLKHGDVDYTVSISSTEQYIKNLKG